MSKHTLTETEALTRIEELVRSPEAEKYRDEAHRGVVAQPYANNRYIRLLDDVRATLAAVHSE